MKKTALVTLMAILAILAVAACGSRPTGSPEYTPATTTAAAADTEWLYTTTAEESSTENTETSATSAATSTSSTATPKPTAKAVNSTASPTTAKPTTTKPAAASKAPVIPPPVTAAQTTTTTRYVPPQTQPPAPQTQAPRPAYTQADCEEIAAAVKAYAESKTKVRFTLKPDLRYDSPVVSYHDVVDLSQSSGKAFVIGELKYNVDQTEWLISGGSGGAPGDAVYYNVVYFDYQGSTMFVLLYT